MLIFLVYVRDPQFYAVPAAGRAKNGNIRIMGFPPIGIMSLSAVLKRAGHECVMFDQANPETPNPVIIEQVRRRRPQLVGLSFLSTTSYPYAKMLARQIRAQDLTGEAASHLANFDTHRASPSAFSQNGRSPWIDARWRCRA